MPRRSPQLVSACLTATLMILVAIALVAGCGSDESNLVGAGLGTAELDTLMRELVVTDLVHMGQLEVYDPDDPLDNRDVLFLGEGYGESSSIVLNYDFSVLDDPDLAMDAAALTRDNVAFAELRVYPVLWYWPNHGADIDTVDVDTDEELRDYAGALKIFDVFRLEAPFDTLSVPGPEPVYDPDPVSVDVGTVPEPFASEQGIRLDLDTVMGWVENRERVGLIIREGEGSQPGLQGYASREMLFGGSTLNTLAASTAVGVSLRIKYEDEPDTSQFYVQLPVADASTWHQVGETSLDPAAGIEVRGHRRSYPVLNFDPGVMPEGIRINLAQVVLTADTNLTYGPTNNLVVSEFPLAMAPDGTRTAVNLDDIREFADVIGGGTVKPEHATEHTVKLNVTSAIQRYINDLQDESMGFLVSRGESFMSGYVESPNPGFFAANWSFYGMDAPEDLRPRLEILYTRVDNLSDGEVD